MCRSSLGLLSDSNRLCKTVRLYTTLVRTVIRKLHMNAEIFILQLGDHVLQSVPVAACDPNHISLNGHLHFSFRILNELYNLSGLLVGNALLNLSLLPPGATGP